MFWQTDTPIDYEYVPYQKLFQGDLSLIWLQFKDYVKHK